MSERIGDWQRVQDLLLEALDLPPGPREELLDDLGSEDPELRREVESLLRAHEEGPLPDPDEDRRFQGRVPERIGEYRPVRHLGEGGMGSVYLAVRERPGFTQKVALKVLHASALSPRVERRFTEERRILALLEHPGIARLIDGGVTPEGRPYLAMEHVEGMDLIAHCDARRLDLRERIRLFMDVCEAVHYAHRQLVVHRDLKPSNILVTPAGRPKLLDFGIAKLLEEDDPGEGVTRTTPWLTPAYASPEQLAGRHVAVPSDIYSLGVLLYEVLCGVRPYRTRDRSLAEVERLVSTTPPARPSARIARASAEDDGVDIEAVAFARCTMPERLRRRLAGDLDVIVLKALAPAPERRYGSAAQLAEDLGRYLDGLPVTARPDSLGYRLGKFVGRHRVSVAAAAVVALSLVGGMTAAARQAQVAREQARIAAGERDRAETEAARARRVTGLMSEIFRLADPDRLRGDSLTGREVLERGVAEIRAELADQPATQGALLQEVARIYRNLGQPERAADLAHEAIELLARSTPGSPEHAAAVGLVAELAADADDSERAVAGFREAIRILEAASPEPDSALAALHAHLGWTLRQRGEHDAAGRSFGTALDIQRDVLGPAHPEVARSLMGLAAVYHDQGRFDQAEALFRDVLDGREALAPDPVVASALFNLGMLSRLRERFAPAVPPLRTALEIRRSLYGPDHPDVYEAMDELGAALHAAGRLGEARTILLAALEGSGSTLGAHHALTTDVRETLARVEADMGHAPTALARYDTVMADKRTVREEDHPALAFTMLWSAAAFRLAGLPDSAASLYRAAEDMAERASGERSIYRALALQGRGALAREAGRLDEAAAHLGEAASIFEEALRPGHRYRLSLRRERAALELARGRADDAATELQAVLEGQRATRPSPHHELGVTLTLLGEARLAAGDTAAGLADLRRARTELAGIVPGDPRVARVDDLLAGLSGSRHDPGRPGSL